MSAIHFYIFSIKVDLRIWEKGMLVRFYCYLLGQLQGTSFIFDNHLTPRPSNLAWNPYHYYLYLNQRRIFKNCFISAHFQTEGDTIYDTLYTTWLSTAKETKVKT